VTKSEPSEKVLSSDAQPPQVITELRRSYTNKLEEVCFYGNRMFLIFVFILNLYSICIFASSVHLSVRKAEAGIVSSIGCRRTTWS
jgi:hypothetical protein